MFGLGYSPQVMNQLGVIPRTSSQFFSPKEQAYMEGFFALTTDAKIQQKLDGLNDQVEALRLADSVNAKLALVSVNRLRDVLDEICTELDASNPAGAPHTPLFGPKFPVDSREIPIQGKILTVSSQRLTDHQSLFGDPYWETVGPSERLGGYDIEMLTGTAAGEIRFIERHVIRGTGAPYIVVDDATDIAPGDRFRVLDATIPQDNLDKRDRSTDWVITTAIRGQFTAVAGGKYFASVFGNAYWDDNSVSLKGRSVTILDGSAPGTYVITAHSQPGGYIEVEGSPGAASPDSFSIVPLSPFETKVQKRGTLRRGDPATTTKYDYLEPSTKRVLTPETLPQATTEQQVVISDEMERIDRYLHRRFHRWFGSWKRLRRFRKTAKRIEKQFQTEAAVHDDIADAVIDLGLFVNIEEPPTTLPPE